MSTELDRLRGIARTTMAYHRVFKSKDGEVVLADLVKVFGLDMPAFIAKPDGGFDPIWAAKRDGQRDPYLHILAKLSVTPEADGNVKPKKKVTTPDESEK